MALGWPDGAYVSEHVAEAPTHCGDGWNGSCVAGDCVLIAQHREIATALRRAYAERLERAAVLVEEWAGDDTYTAERTIAAIRAEKPSG